MNIVTFFKKQSEGRTQFFLVTGFIILPVLAMIYIFMDLVLKESQGSSERLKIPAHIMEAQKLEQSRDANQ